MKIFYGGNVNIGRRMHQYAKESERFGNIRAMSEADFRLVNLTCVTATCGEYFDKRNGDLTYLRARPEQLNILSKADIDCVLTANHHVGDYGSEALLEQNALLDRAGIFHCGTGKNIDEAASPCLVRVADLTIAIFNVDAMVRNFAATDNRAGTFFLPIEPPQFWKETFAEKISAVRRNVDLVFVAVNWGINVEEEPSERLKTLGRLLIDCGADAVLGCHPTIFCHVEKYKERPIIYGAGIFLTDSLKQFDTGAFLLTADQSGIRRIEFLPLRFEKCCVTEATRSKERIVEKFIKASGATELEFNPPPRPIANTVELPALPKQKTMLEAEFTPRAEYIAEKVPDDAIIKPVQFGELKMLGCKIETPLVKRRSLICVETFWSIEKKTDRSLRLSIKAVPEHECLMPDWGARSEHELCDWMFPTDRWEPNVIYRERFGIAPPTMKNIVNVDLRLEFQIDDRKYLMPTPVELQLPNRALKKKEYPASVFESKFNQCWTAQQIVDVTDGEWIVPPPDGWFVNSVAYNWEHVIYPVLKAPLLFAPMPQFWTSEEYPARLPSKIVGVVVKERVDKLPADLPQLQVKNGVPWTAAVELGFAARQRFRGRMIAVTGSSGKTTTVNMIKHVLSKSNDVFATYNNQNGITVPYMVFASVRANHAFAIMELSAHSLAKMKRGSVTYDLPPDIAVVTSIAAAHLELFGGVEDVAKAKSNIFCGMSPGGYAVLNHDMLFYDLIEKRAREAKLNVISFGRHSKSTIRMSEIQNGGVFTVDGKTYTLNCPVPDIQLYDALATVGVSMAAGVPIDFALKSLLDYKTMLGRGNIIELNRNGKRLKIINSAFNANIGSMSGDLKFLKTLEPSSEKRVAVLGDIAELGQNAASIHLQLIEPILASEADRVLLGGENMKHVWDAIKGKVNGEWFPSYEEVNAAIDDWLKDGDTVLVKSSHSTHFDEVVTYLKTLPPIKLDPSELYFPKALFDVRDFLPKGMTPEMNGRLPNELLQEIEGDGKLYVDAARSFNAMVGTAKLEGVSIEVGNAFRGYRTIQRQEQVFKKRFGEIDANTKLREGSIRVAYDGKFWQLNEGTAFAAVPGTSSHGFGLAVDIKNIDDQKTKNWLAENAARFGFRREYVSEPWHYTYIGSRAGIPNCVLEYERRA